ncbi:MAG: hypothetical protein WAT41_05440 [Flavobacteriales bacterium]
MEEQSLIVQRTARFHTLGSANSASQLWVVLHGYGQLARFFLRPFVGLETGKLIAAPEALSRFYTDEAHTRVGATWMTREDREHEVEDQVAYLDRLVDRLLADCGKDVTVNVLGFSQGVATACRWAVRGKTTFARVVLWSGTMPPELGRSEFQSAFGAADVILVHGTSDNITKEDVYTRNQRILGECGINYLSIPFNGGHQLDRLILKSVMERNSNSI